MITKDTLILSMLTNNKYGNW